MKGAFVGEKNFEGNFDGLTLLLLMLCLESKFVIKSDYVFLDHLPFVIEQTR